MRPLASPLPPPPPRARVAHARERHSPPARCLAGPHGGGRPARVVHGARGGRAERPTSTGTTSGTPWRFWTTWTTARLLTFTLLGEPCGVWRDSTASELTFRCTADKCPHRLVPLSEGRVNEKGEIECGYHGWTFDGVSGKCTSIPQLGRHGDGHRAGVPSVVSRPTPRRWRRACSGCSPSFSGSTEADQPALPLIRAGRPGLRVPGHLPRSADGLRDASGERDGRVARAVHAPQLRG